MIRGGTGAETAGCENAMCPAAGLPLDVGLPVFARLLANDALHRRVRFQRRRVDEGGLAAHLHNVSVALSIGS